MKRLIPSLFVIAAAALPLGASLAVAGSPPHPTDREGSERGEERRANDAPRPQPQPQPQQEQRRQPQPQSQSPDPRHPPQQRGHAPAAQPVFTPAPQPQQQQQQQQQQQGGRGPDRAGDRGREGQGDRRGNAPQYTAPPVVARPDPRNDARTWRDGRDARDYRDARDSRDARNGREVHDSRDMRPREWRHDNAWYDQYRAQHYRVDRGRFFARQRFSLGAWYPPPGYYGTRVWIVGDWLPRPYYDDRRYYIDDYPRFDLYDPPGGCAWVRSGNDAVLIDLDSGEVIDAVYDLFW
jgi:Ni/Co efflux regulator RcnB